MQAFKSAVTQYLAQVPPTALSTQQLIIALTGLAAEKPKYAPVITGKIIPALQTRLALLGPPPSASAGAGYAPPMALMAGGGGAQQGGGDGKEVGRGHPFFPTDVNLLTKPSDLVGYRQLQTRIKLKISQPIRYRTFYGGAKRRGIWMYGPGGTGKTAFAESIGVETGLPFFLVTPQDILGAYVGESEKNMANLFSAAEKSPKGAIILFDEADSLLGGDNEHTVSVINAFKTATNRVANQNIVIIAATNYPSEIKQSSVKRRLETQIYVGLPSHEDSVALLNFYINKQLTCGRKTTVDVEKLADQRGVAGLTADELKRLVSAAFELTKPGKDELTELCYCPLPAGPDAQLRYEPKYPAARPAEGEPAKCAKPCENIEVMAPLGANVCWTPVTQQAFDAALQLVTPNTTWKDLLDYYNHAVTSNDEAGRKRVCQDMDRFSLGGFNKEGRVKPGTC